MKPAIMHLVVRDTLFPDRLRTMAVTTVKARRYWGRDITTETAMNVSAWQVLATFTGPDGDAKAKAICEPIERLNKVLRERNRAAYKAYETAKQEAQREFDAALKIEIDKVQS